MTKDAKPMPMERGGFYNRNSSLQADAASSALRLFAAAAAAVPLAGDGPVRIVDYASSQGRNSMAPMTLAIDEVRRRCGPQRSIEVVHTDLPDNDFSALFSLLDADPASYLRGDPHVHPSAIGRSYFEPLFAPRSVDLAWNSVSLHWLSRVPVRPPDTFFLIDLTDPAHIAARDGQLREDWTRFLALRDAELKPGGRFVAAMLAKNGDTGTWPVLRQLFAILEEARLDGSFRPTEARRLTVPIAFRSAEQLREPFGASGRFGGLVVEHLEILEQGDPLYEAMQTSGDRETYARTWTGIARAIYSPLFTAALDPGHDPGAFLDQIFGRLERRLRDAPIRNHFVQANIVIHKLG